MTPPSSSSLGPSLPPWLGPQAMPIPSVSHGWGTREDLGWGQGQGGAGASVCLTWFLRCHAPSQASCMWTPPSPYSPINQFSALLSPCPAPPQHPSLALTWLGSSSGEGPSPQPIPSAESWGDGAGGSKGGGSTRGEGS